MSGGIIGGMFASLTLSVYSTPFKPWSKCSIENRAGELGSLG